MKSCCVGLTGIIGSGKSLVAEYFSELGIDVIDTDKISHELTEANGLAIPLICESFGNDYLLEDGSLDRQKIRSLVFNDISAKNELEKILHPLIYEKAKSNIIECKSQYIILVVPLLFRSPKYLELISRSIYVDCDNQDELIRRITKRSNLSAEEAYKIIKSQVSRRTQLDLANDIIHNGVKVSLQDLKMQVVSLHKYYKQIY